MNNEVLEFIRSNPECVLATSSPDGQPEAATVLFAVSDDFTFYFGTMKNYRKFGNLLKNKKVAVVVGVRGSNPRTVQAEGEVEILENEDDIDAAKKIFEEKNPAMKSFMSLSLVYLRLKPRWLRYQDETKGGADNFKQIIP